MVKNIFYILIYLFFAEVALAKPQVDITLQPESGTINDVYILEVSVTSTDSVEISAPIFDENSFFNFEQTSNNTSMVSINGKMTHTASFGFNLSAKKNLKPGTYKTPTGKISIAGSEIKLPQKELKIHKQNKEKKKNKNAGFDAIQFVSEKNPYIGQQIVYQTEIATPQDITNQTISDVEFKNFWRESFGEWKESIRAIGNQRIRRYSQKIALFPTETGFLSIPSRTYTADLLVPVSRGRRNTWSPFSDLWPGLSFQNSKRVRKNFVLDEIEVTVKPLPSPPISYNDYIPVGQVNLETSTDKNKLMQGESLTAKIIFFGDANLRPLKLPNLENIKGFKIYEDKAKVETKINKNSIQMTKTFTLAIVPQEAGELTFPSLEILTFDPIQEKYKTLKTKTFNLNVTTNPSFTKKVSQKPTEQPKEIKKEITPLAQDILPQHDVSKMLQKKNTINNSVIWTIVVLLSLLSFSFRFHLYRKEKYLSDPLLIRQEQAFKTAFKELQQPELDSLSLIFKNYLSDKFRTKVQAFTSKEIKKFIEEKTANQILATESKELLSTLENLQYSKAKISNKNQENALIEQTIKLIKQIENI